MKQLSRILSDPNLAGSTFNISRRTFTQEMGEINLASVEGFTASGSVQPAASEDLTLFPQEERSEEMIILLSPFHFRLGEKTDAAFTTADIVSWRGKKYRVVRAKSWANPAGFYKAWAVRIRDKEK